MDQVGAWIGGALGCLLLYILFDILVTGFFEAIFLSRWGKRGRRLSTKLEAENPDAVTFLIGPMGGPGVSGNWYTIVVDERGITAYRATGSEAWSEPWSGVRSVSARFGMLVIDRVVDGPRSISPKVESGEDLDGDDLTALTHRVMTQRPIATKPN